METTKSLNSERHEYRLQTWYITIWVMLGGIIFSVGMAVVVSALFQLTTKAVVVGLLSCLISVIMIRLVLRQGLVLSGSRVELLHPTSLDYPIFAELSQIEGFRTYRWASGGKQICLIVKDPGGVITFSAYLKTDDTFRRWMEQIPDLDALDREERQKRKHSLRDQ